MLNFDKAESLHNQAADMQSFDHPDTIADRRTGKWGNSKSNVVAFPSILIAEMEELPSTLNAVYRIVFPSGETEYPAMPEDSFVY